MKKKATGKRLRSVFLFVYLLPLFLVGCNRGPTYELVPATGTLTIRGKPAANIMVQSMPDILADLKGPTSTGITDENGQFVLRTADNREGAVPGKHILILADQEAERTEQGQEPSKPPRIDTKYMTIQGGISYTIEAGKPIEINID